jgi:ABC-type nitrate/sulfonate/bicarbonate transport system substrate-binding protein
MRRSFGRWAGIALAVLPGLLAAGPAAGQAVKVKVGSALSPPSLDSITPYVALERGLFKKYGLDVEMVESAAAPPPSRPSWPAKWTP